MTTKRKPEDVVVDEKAARMASAARYSAIANGVSPSSADLTLLKTYIAEAALIPRPQTVEEWVAQMPEGVWEGIDPQYTHLVCFPANDGSFLSTTVATIPRPKPPRMTDEEIRGKAFSVGLLVYHTLIKAGEPEVKAQLEGFRAEDAERAKLDKERGNE